MSAATNISLARGAPSLDIIAVEDLKASAQRAFERDPAGAFSYGTRRATRGWWRGSLRSTVWSRSR